MRFYELDKAPQPQGVMVSEFSPRILKAIDKIDEQVKTLRIPFARHELQRALMSTTEME